MSTNHDNFFTISNNPSGFSLADAWVVLGGNYIVLEFAKTGVPPCATSTGGVGGGTPTCDLTEGVWQNSIPEMLFVATGGNFIGTIVQVTHEYRLLPDFRTVVLVKIRLPRTVAQTETVQIVPVVGPIATDGTSTVTFTGSTTTIRNYSCSDSSGAPTYALRTGASSYIKQVSPLLDASRVFNLSGGTLANGILTGTGLTVNTTRGTISQINTDPHFNNERGFQTDSNWIGKLQNFTGQGAAFTWYFAVRMSVGSTLFYSKVTESGGGTGPTIEDKPTPIGDLAFTVNTNNNSSVSYTSTDYWALSEPGKNHTLTWQQPGTDIVYTGDCSNRTYVFALRSDGTNISIHQGGGNTVEQVAHVASNATLDANSYYALRSFGQVKFAEFCHISRKVSDTDVQEHLAFLDKKYNTQAKAFYVDLNAGLDSNTGETTGSPYLTLEKALSRCLACYGDHVYIKNDGTNTRTNVLDLEYHESGVGPLGYSPEYPFVLGTYGTRTTRPAIDFDYGVSHYIRSNARNENISINGIHLLSTERDILHGSFAGQAALKTETDGYGIQLRASFNTQPCASSLQVSDCEIERCLRHPVSVENTSSSQHYGAKYSGVRKTLIHDCYNFNYMSENQSHEISSVNYGIAGIYTENLTGFSVEDLTFFRVGWSPDLVVDSGITNLSGDFNGTAILSSALFPFATAYEPWAGSNNSVHNIQRVRISEINGSPTEQFVFISSAIYYPGSGISYGLPVKSFGGILSNGNTCKFSVLDPLPKCYANCDIVFGNDMYGSLIVSDSIFLDSSGLNIFSTHSYYAYGCVSQDNQVGFQTASEYTKISTNYFGGSCGTNVIRKSPNAASNSLLSIRNHQFVDEVANMKRSIITSKFLGAVNLEITNNIFSGITTSAGVLGFGTLTNGLFSSGIYFNTNTAKMQRATVTKNTFHGIIGTCIAYFTTEQNNNNIQVQISRNIFDQQFEYGNFDWMYAFRNPFSAQSSFGWFVINFGGPTNKNIYSRLNGSTAPTTQDFASRLGAFVEDVTFQIWQNWAVTDSGDWANITYADEFRSLNTYNSDILGITESVGDFFESAIVAHEDGWDTSYSASEIISYIREGWRPTNLDQANYNNDYVGAVSFDFTPPTVTFNPAFGQSQTLFGYGKGM